MKNKFHHKLLALFLFVLVFASCDLLKNEDDPTPVDKYLLSYNKQKTYLPSIIKFGLETQVDSYPEIQPLIDKMEHSVAVYTITYNTTFQGDPIVASGLVAIPTTSGVQFPVLSFQNGTNTLNSMAPSVNPDSQIFLMLEFIASTGFIISVPDYLGFGASNQMFHPYMHKESTIQAVTDMLRAVKELVNNHLFTEINDDLYITGYSQGGWATMQLQKAIETQYSSEFNLKASACAAGPYDLNYINKYVLKQQNYPMPYFLGYVFNSYINLGLVTTPASEIFNTPFDNVVATYYDGTHSGEEINAALSTTVGILFTDNYRHNAYTDSKFSSIVNGMSSNSISAWKTVTPTMILHGTNDEFIPPQVSLNIYEDFLTKGVSTDQITYIPLAGLGHTSGIIPAELQAINWFIDLKEAE